MALSLALLFSVMGLMNFAYGELIMVGGYTMYTLRDESWLLRHPGGDRHRHDRLDPAWSASRSARCGDASPITLLVASFARLLRAAADSPT